MKTTKTIWTTDDSNKTLVAHTYGDSVEEQPGFGISINWNKPKEFYKPYIIIRFWHYMIQIGWLF